MQKAKEIIAVIGGGSIGISFLIQLIEEAVKAAVVNRFEILLFEPQEMVGPGYAYQADFTCNLLNTTADTMSAIYAEKNNFIQWLGANEAVWRIYYPDLELRPNAYLPRSLFGLYLNSVYQQILDKTKKHGIPFRLIKDKVIDIETVSSTQSNIITESSGKFIADRIILSLGNMPSEKFKELNSVRGYFQNSYPCVAVTQAIPSTASVCIIGTSLSSIDMVLSLKEAGHTGSIVCVSRNGRLPSVRGNLNKKHQLKKIRKDRIDSVIESRDGVLDLRTIAKVLIEEYEYATGEKCNLAEILNANVGMQDYISTEIKFSNEAERVWQSIICSTNDIIDYLWHRLSQADKRIFNNFFRGIWLSYRVSFPLSNALKIQELLRTGQLQIFGGVSSITYDENEKLFLVPIKDKRTGFRSIIQSEFVVNATSYSLDVTTSQDSLVRNLLQRGHAIPNEFGGFFVDYDTGSLVRASGQINDRMTALGSLVSGVYFWTNAMDVNARLASKQAKRLVQSLKEISFDYLDFNEVVLGKPSNEKIFSKSTVTQINFNLIGK